MFIWHHIGCGIECYNGVKQVSTIKKHRINSNTTVLILPYVVYLVFQKAVKSSFHLNLPYLYHTTENKQGTSSCGSNVKAHAYTHTLVPGSSENASFTSWRLGTVTGLRVLPELEEERDDLFPMGFKLIPTTLGLAELRNMN